MSKILISIRCYSGRYQYQKNRIIRKCIYSLALFLYGSFLVFPTEDRISLLKNVDLFRRASIHEYSAG